MKRLTKKTRRLLTVTALALMVALSVMLAVALIGDAVERRRLEEERREKENGQPIVTAPSTTPPSLLSGYRLLSQGISDFELLYFGDATIFGYGASDFYGERNDTSAYPYRLQIRAGLRELYCAPEGFLGRVYPHITPSFEIGLADLIASPLNFRLAILAPSSDNVSATEGATFGRGFTPDLESMIRGIRSSRPYCDILLVIPHSATDEEAEAILSLAAHYGLVTADVRPAFTADATLVHTEGEHTGLPNDRGHTAYAEVILAAITDAADREHVSPALPAWRLY